MELILLTLDRDEFLALHKRAAAGDRQAIEAIADLWEGTETVCFLCDEPARPAGSSEPVFTHVLPDVDNGRGGVAQLLAVPLCPGCRDLPPTVRWSRSLRVLKRMWSARLSAERGRKKTVTFQFNRTQRHHPA
jgi:hypothetical protein